MHSEEVAHPPAKRLMIDCTDFMTFFIRNNGVSGISRMILCLMEILHKNEEAIFVRYQYGRFEQLIFPRGALVVSHLHSLADRRNARTSLLRRPGIRKKIEGLFKLLFRRNWLKTQPLEPQDGDSWFFPGAAWTNLEAIDHIARLKKQKNLRVLFYIHDLIPYYGEAYVSHGAFLQFRSYIEKVVEIADQIFCNSEYSRKDLERFSGFHGAFVIPLAHEFGLSDHGTLTPRAAQERARRLVGGDDHGPRPFVLCMGTIELRKNQINLLRAWITLSRRRAMPLLVLAGRYGAMSDDVRILLDREYCPVKVIEGPSDEYARALYASCQFTVFPSHFEGWGLPVGESLWFGKPCLASNATSIPEVGGSHCRYFDPASLDDLIEKLEDMLDDPPDMSYLTRDQLRTWDQVAQDLRRALYEQPVSSAPLAVPAPPRLASA